jgi:hypothetical protein
VRTADASPQAGEIDGPSPLSRRTGHSFNDQLVGVRQWFPPAPGAVIWLAIAFWPARVAARKGHSFFGYFLLSLLFFPLSLILAYVVEDRSRPAYG